MVRNPKTTTSTTAKNGEREREKNMRNVLQHVDMTDAPYCTTFLFIQ